MLYNLQPCTRIPWVPVFLFSVFQKLILKDTLDDLSQTIPKWRQKRKIPWRTLELQISEKGCIWVLSVMLWTLYKMKLIRNFIYICLVICSISLEYCRIFYKYIKAYIGSVPSTLWELKNGRRYWKLFVCTNAMGNDIYKVLVFM